MAASPIPQQEIAVHGALQWAHPLVQEWFTAKFGTPTEPQIEGWPAILRGEATLISAPTGSGKTLAAFLVCIDGLLRAALNGSLGAHTHVVYVSPLKALSNDVQKNLDGPLRDIQQLALERGYLCPEIRTGVRTGDTPAKDRAGMLRNPPHILVTTPESLYLLLTAGKSRANLQRVSTVIVDEIHAIADDKRGSHLALSLERLEALVCGENRLMPGAMLTGLARAPQRIGLSATQNPIELVANFLVGSCGEDPRLKPAAPSGGSATSVSIGRHDVAFEPHTCSVDQDIAGANGGSRGLQPTESLHSSGGALAPAAPQARRKPATIIQVGQRRTLDLAIEVPSDELSSITSIAMWTEIFDKLAALAMEHRSTLVFVNTRRLVEKISFELTERLGADAVAAHHGSLSRALRLDAEQRLKNGEVRILIATASLELGIDIGNVDLMCQIATTRAVAVAMQRVGRAGHWRGAIPKGRFFALTRDDLMEQAALLRKMVAGELDQLEIPEAPIDVLMQQIVAMCGAESWQEDTLFRVLRRAWPYRNLTREHFDELLTLLHNGIESSRGRYGAYLLRDRVQGHLHARRGARMIAIANGGAIPDTSLFSVMLQPENVQIATLDEHFAVDSSPGDVVLLGNTSWRIQRIDPQGKVLVEDAHGAPPSIPFWEGEAPQRTAVLSSGVAELRAEIDRRTCCVKPNDVFDFEGAELQLRQSAPQNGGALAPEGISAEPHFQVIETVAWLKETCFVNDSAARQMVFYIVAGRAALGAVPTKETIIAERFFDEGGGQQLILHAPFGGRLNKAWGLALRKRFCRGFNFELQAAATDNGINISLAEQHSFPLGDVFHFLSEQTARDLLEQASIPSPLFKNRWRWAAGRSLQLLRMQKGKRVPPQIQRTRSDDLLASVFPHASACPETMVGDIVIPDHPLVREVMRDTLTEAMDIDGLNEVLRGIADGSIRCLAVDTPVPSVFSHELVNAMPYAFLDDEDAAGRRTRSVNLRRTLPDSVSEGAGRLDQAAIDTVRAQLWPDIRDEHEMHDLLLQLVVLPITMLQEEACTDAQSYSRFEEAGLQPHAADVSPQPRFERAVLQFRRHPSTQEGVSAPEGMLAVSQTRSHQSTRHWSHFLSLLIKQGRAFRVDLNGTSAFIATERLPETRLLWPEAELPEPQQADSSRPFVLNGTESRPEQTFSPRDSAAIAFVQGWLQILGPTTAQSLGTLVHVHPRSLHQSLLAMEMQGLAMRGVFEHAKPADDQPFAIEWCERRILQRIHRLTLAGLRKAVEPVAPAAFMRWLLEWHHVAPGTQLSGEEGVLAAIEQLEGFEAPAAEWERTLLPTRVAGYQPQWLDNLCLAGVIGWGRISPHPAWLNEDGGAPRRVVPTSAAPITFFLRESADWLQPAMQARCVPESTLAESLSPEALRIRALLRERGAAFTADLQRTSGLSKLQTTTALWELATAGLAAADGWDQMRAMMDPRRKSAAVEQTPAVSLRKRAAARTTAGRWSLLCDEGGQANQTVPVSASGAEAHHTAMQEAIAYARRTEAALAAQARLLLCRYGVLFRDLLQRESNAPKWRDLAPMLRRMEARGEIRGGRFVSGPFGEQFAVPEAADSLRKMRSHGATPAGNAAEVSLAAADPLNLVGIVVPGERVPAIPGRAVQFSNGVPLDNTGSAESAIPTRTRARTIAEILRNDMPVARPARNKAMAASGLFS